MATYLQGVTDSPESLHTPVVQTDFSFLASNMQKKEGQYQQGLSQVASDYSAILNAPITGPEMQQRRAEYLKNTQEGLKKISTTDLSLPKNVAQAESLYAPFWQDDGMVANIGITKFANNNTSKIQSGLFSKDKDERDMYDPIQLKDQQGMLDELSAAGTDSDKIARVQRRQVTPFRNFKQALNEAAGKDGIDLDWDEITNGGQTITTWTNGQRSLKDFKTWARSILSGSDWDTQFQTIGRVSVDAMKRQVRADNPGITDDQIKSKLVEYGVNKLQQSHVDNIADNNLEIANVQKQIDLIIARAKTNKNGKIMTDKEGNPIITDADKPLYAHLQGYMNQLKNNGTGLDIQLKDFNSLGRERITRELTDNPQDYFATLAKDNTVNNFAVGQASKEKKEIKENTAYTAAAINAREWARVRVEQGNLGEKRREFDLSLPLEKEKADASLLNAGYKISPDGSYIKIPTTEDTKDIPNIQTGDVNKDNTAYKHELGPYDRLKERLHGEFITAHDLLWSASGAASALIGTAVKVGGVDVGKISATDLDIVKDALLNKSLNKEYNYSDKEIKALQKVGGALGENNLNPDDMTTALKEKLGKEEKDKNGVPTDESIALSKSMKDAEDLLNHSNTVTKELDKSVSEYIIHNPKHSNLVENNPDGSKRLVNQQDVAKYFEGNDVDAINSKGEKVHFSANELAKAWMNNKLEPYSQGADIFHSADFVINGEEYNLQRVGNTNYNGNIYNQMWPKTSNSGVLNKKLIDILGVPKTTGYLTGSSGIMGRYGNPKDFADSYRDAQNAVISNSQEYQNTTGVRGMQVSFNDNKPTQRATLNQTAIDLAVPSNRGAITQNGETYKDEEDMAAVSSILRSGNKYIQSSTFSPFAGTDGGPAMVIDFKPVPENSKIVEQNGNKMEKIITKGQLVVDISPEASSKNLKDLVNSHGNTMYSDMYTGTAYNSSDLQASHNYEYHIEPTTKDSRGRYTEARVTIKGKLINAQTGKLQDYYPYNDNGKGVTVPFTNQTPYQIKQAAENFYIDYLRTNKANYNQYRMKDNNANFSTLENQQ